MVGSVLTGGLVLVAVLHLVVGLCHVGRVGLLVGGGLGLAVGAGGGADLVRLFRARIGVVFMGGRVKKF